MNQGELCCRRGMKYFELGEYEKAVLDWIASYEAGYEKELVLAVIYECFIQPKEQDFQENYKENSVGISQMPYHACVLDFIPVSDTRFYIYDKEEQKFYGLFDIENICIPKKKTGDNSVLYTDTWDIREILFNMKENEQDVIYLLLEGVEQRFMSFCKLPHFKEIYLENVVVFQNEVRMRFFFEENERHRLPKEMVTLNLEKYSVIFQAICQHRIEKNGRWMARIDMHPLKHKIKDAAENYVGMKEIIELVKTYETQCPQDYDLYALKAWVLFQEGRKEAAYEMIQSGIKKNPYNYVANQIARMLCRETERYAEAIKYDCIIAELKDIFPYLNPVESWRQELEMEVREYTSEVVASENQENIEKLKEEERYLNTHINKCFGLADYTYFGGGLNLVGTEYEDIYGNRKYNGFHNDIGLEMLIPELQQKYISWWVTKLECRKIQRVKHLILGTDGEYLLPVLQEENEKTYKFITPDGGEVTCRNKKAQHFEYYRLPPKTQLEAEEELCIGNPIALKQNPQNKKMVLNIFVDGISQKVIDEEGLENLMPYTHAFFSKGSCCTNAYTTAEWTLPAIASSMTGISTVRHMLFHNILTNVLPEDIPVLAEYFKEWGYQTAKIDGGWRSSQIYGYGRGVDRIIFQHQNMGMHVEQLVNDVLDHMKMMKDTNQFIWMGCGELHDIADGFSQRPSVQAGTPLKERAVEDTGITSVKQTYSENKRAAYIRQMKHIDEYLEQIYRYLENTYEDNEMIVTLFGDHGQGYLVKDGEHFLSEGRSKVAMMFRGETEAGGICNEVVSICDYVPILCKLAGIPLKNKNIDGNLPVFFGGKKEREYAITESIHPGDPYQAAIVSKDYTYYFTSGGLVEYDGRFELGEYSFKLLDRNGEECKERELEEHYYNILMQHIGSLIVY